MSPDDEVCLCFHVTLRKVRGYLERENPRVASLISECLGAGTGCMWCVPFLKHLHAQHQQGIQPDLAVSPQRYIEARSSYKQSNVRDEVLVAQATDSELPPDRSHSRPDDRASGPASDHPTA